MRINPKIYKLADGAVALDRHELSKERIIEIYNMDDFEDIYNEFTGQSKFAVWSSEDGVHYRLFIESGYYEVLRDLYGENVNEVWLDFWDACESIGNKFSRRIVMPLTLVCIVTYLIGALVWHWDLIVCLGIFLGFLLVLMIINRFSKKKIAEENYKSIARLRDILGEEHFQNLLTTQRDYPDEFYQSKYPDAFNPLEEIEEDTIDDETVLDAEIVNNEDVTSDEVESKE